MLVSRTGLRPAAEPRFKYPSWVRVPPDVPLEVPAAPAPVAVQVALQYTQVTGCLVFAPIIINQVYDSVLSSRSSEQMPTLRKTFIV